MVDFSPHFMDRSHKLLLDVKLRKKGPDSGFLHFKQMHSFQVPILVPKSFIISLTLLELQVNHKTGSSLLLCWVYYLEIKGSVFGQKNWNLHFFCPNSAFISNLSSNSVYGHSTSEGINCYIELQCSHDNFLGVSCYDSWYLVLSFMSSK